MDLAAKRALRSIAVGALVCCAVVGAVRLATPRVELAALHQRMPMLSPQVLSAPSTIPTVVGRSVSKTFDDKDDAIVVRFSDGSEERVEHSYDSARRLVRVMTRHRDGTTTRRDLSYGR